MTADAPQDDPSASPDVVTFPPVIFATFFAIGYVTDLAFPLPFEPAAGLRRTAGAALIAFGAGLALWAGWQFSRAKTSVDVRKPARALVTEGPYRWSRNPMYVATGLLYAGFACLAALPWTLLLLAPCLVVVQIWVVRREERHLEARFGEAYSAYRRRVRRWL